MSNAIVLDCQQITKHFQDVHNAIHVLSGVDLRLHQGEQIAIVGRSGSGKSTLLQILGGLDFPSSGSIFLQKQNLAEISERQLENLRNHQLGFVYQSHHLLGEFSALENVAMPMLISGNSVNEAKQRASTLLAKVGLSERIEHRPSELSGGERQRVAIARALINDPMLLLADEPTGNLDDETADEVFAVLQQINREKQTTVVMVTHDRELAHKMDRIFELQAGVLSPLTQSENHPI